jgi:hypothetical protein
VDEKTLKEFIKLSNMTGYFLLVGIAGFVMGFITGDQYIFLKETLFFLGGLGLGGALGSFIARFAITIR